MLGMILLAILAAFGLSVIAAGVKIIGQAEVMVIERLGRFHRVARSGLNLLIPFIERPRPIDVRYVASTAKDLQSEIDDGRFRRDLYFRLAGATFTIPPLRDRRDEILPLAEQFVAAAAAPLGRSFAFSEDAKQWLTVHSWSGNIRELRNACERAVLLATGLVIERRAAASQERLDAPLPDMKRLTNEVIQVLDRRIIAERERRGRI